MKMMKKNGGFTLVELIVVIAILAILAGVAIPAYSGYIKKASEAADTQIVSAVNTAFAAACTENMVMPKDVTATVTVANKKVTEIEVSAVANVTGDAFTALKSELEDDFDFYFEGNDDAELKYYTEITADTENSGNFVGVAQ